MPRITKFRSDVSWAGRFAAQLVLAASLIGVGNPACTDEPARPAEDPAARARATVLIENLRKEREKLVSAVVQVQGGIAFTRDAPPPERTIRGLYAFDHSLGALRFDSSRTTQVRVVPPGEIKDIKARLAAAEMKNVEAKVIHLSTRDVSAGWRKPQGNSYGSVNLGPPRRGSGVWGGDLATTHFLFDLRACGLMSRFDISDGKGSGVKEYCENLLKMSVESVTENDGLALVVLRSGLGEHRLTIDTARQFTPAEYRVNWKKGPSASSDGSSTSRVKWMESNGIMVPKSFTIEFDWPDEKQYGFYNFICLWKKVNQSIDKSYFDYKVFPDIPDGTDVWDSRGEGAPVIVGFWTREGIIGPEEDSEDGPSGVDPTVPRAGDAKNEQTLIEGTNASQERDDNGLKMDFVWCPPGKFVMGSPPGEPERFDSEDQVDVVLTRGFWIGKYEVTQGEWAQLKTPLLWKGRQGVKEGDDFPATYLSWENAMAFCRKLTRQERAAGRLPTGWHYTLPTEAQWEYACRAGTTTRFSFGDDVVRLEDYAWFRELVAGLNERYAHAVGEKKPNPWGIHDMYGNVNEWCRDAWQKKLSGGTDPCVRPGDDQRVFRGGWYNCPSVMCRSAYRDCERARDRMRFMGELGFRVVLCPVEQVQNPAP